MTAATELDVLGDALLHAPADAAILAELEELAERTGDFVALARIYRTVASRPLGLEQQVDLRSRLGRLYSVHLGELDRAIATYRRILDLSPGHSAISDALEALYVTTERWADLANYLADRGQADQLIDVLARHLPDTPAEQAASYLEVSRLCEEHLDDVDRAIAAAERAVSLDPGSLDAIRTLRRLYTAIEAPAQCLDMLELELGTVTDDADRAAVLVEMARLCEDELGDMDRAAECIENLLAIDSQRIDAYGQLEDCYRSMGAWQELADCYERHAAIEPDAAIRTDLWASVAGTYRDQLDDADRAAWAFQQLAGVAEAELGDADRSAAAYFAIVELDPSCEPARVALERLLRDPRHALEAARVLEPIYRDSDESKALIAVCEVLCEHAEEPWQKSELLVRIARLELAGDRPDAADAALAAFERALLADPSDETVHGEMEELAAATQSWAALAAIYTRVAEAAPAVETRALLGCRLGRIYKDELGEPALAIESYRAALALASTADTVAVLEELYVTTERWTELADHLRDRGSWDRLVDVVARYLPDEPDAHLRCYLDIARVCEERLDDLDQAVEAADQALSADATSRDALGTLFRLHHRMAAYERCLDVLELELDVVSGDQDHIDVLSRMAQLCEENLDDLDRAAECVENILRIDGARVDSYRQLETYYRRMTAWPALAACYRRHVAIEPDPAARMTSQRALAKLYEEELLDDAAAVAVYTAMLAELPLNPTIRAALDRLQHKLRGADD